MKDKIIKNLSEKTDVIKDEDKRVDFIELYLTGRCQLNCRYCRPTALEDMEFETAKEAIDQLMESESDNVKIQFFGGEPLLRFEMIDKCVNYINYLVKKKHKNMELCISTNGLLLEKKITEFLIKNNIEVIFSVDGMEKSQIANRPNHSIKKNKESHNKIISNLENISQTNLNFSINMVVGPDNLEHLEENVEFLFNKGAKRIRVSYMMGVYWEMSQIKDLFRKVSYLFKKHNMKYTAITACKDEPVLISSGIAINYKGDIYVGTTYPLLHKFNSLKKINYYGNIYKNKLSDIKTNKKKQLIRALSSTSEDTDEFHLLANNIFLGINYQKMFQRLEKKRRD